MTAELGTLLPNGFTIESFTKQESVNHHMKDGSVNQTADNLTFTVPKSGILYAGKNYTINTRFGNFSGVLTNDDDVHNIYKGLNLETGAVLSILSKFNVILPIKPFRGALEQYVNYMASLVSFTGRIVVRDDPYTPTQVKVVGSYANVYEELVKVLTLHEMEIQQVSDTIMVRPIRKLELNGDLFKDSMPQVTYSKSLDVKPYISANWYEQDEIWNSVCVYPVQKTEPVDNPGNVYIAPLAPSSQNTLSVNNAGIGDGSDYVEQVFDIQGSLEHVNQPQCSLPPAFTYTPPPYGASTVYAFFGKWQVVGKSEVEIADPSWLDNDILRANEQFGKLGVLVHCLSNNVYYRCTQEYIPFNMEKQTPVQYAVFLPFVVYSNVGFATIEDVDKYINNHKVPDNTLGFYTVSNKHGQYIMPEQWINAGGKLEVVLEKESSKLKVRVWGADLSLNLPITTQNPNVSGYAGKDGDFVGLDISGGVTSNTIVYKYDNTRNVGDKWATVDGDVYDVIYPYQPYRIAIVTNEKEYDGLYITGNGIRYTPHTETIMSSNSEINAEQDEDNTLVIDNPYCTDQPTALKIANEVDAYSNGITYTFSGDVKHFSDSAIIKAHKGSFDYVTEFALENTAHGTYNEDSTFFKNQNENTFAEITDYIMNQSSLHVADTEFGNIAGAFIKINNRSYFRITEATITPSGISISGYAMMTLGDWDNAIAALDKNMTLGDWDAELSAVNQRERQDGYTLEMWEQELLRLTV